MNINELGDDFVGWKTPNTYDEDFSSPPPRSGVYMLVGLNDDEFKCRELLYIGSAKSLAIRYEKHEVRRVLQNIYKRVEFWFHEVDLYRNREKELIKKYQPKFNTQWR
jgi:excinuclease UvrABC nuclease subunit